MFDFLKKTKFKIISPAKGKIKSITEVQDEAFSSKSMGDGFAIEPSKGEVYSPIDGVVEMLFPTLHALGLKSSNGTEILIHIGIETVELDGEGFKAFVSQGQKIKAGDKLIEFDMEFIKTKVPSTDIMVIFTSGESFELIKKDMVVEALEEDIVSINNK